MVEIPDLSIVKIPIEDEKITVDKLGISIIHFELSSESNPISAAAQSTAPTEIPKQNDLIKSDKEASTVQTSGGYLAKPSHIYAQEAIGFSEEASGKQESKLVEEPTSLQPVQIDEPVVGMQLVVKDSLEATEEHLELNVHQAQPIMNSSVEEPPAGDETDELKRRAIERIAKLRNLSFNMNAADPNNEFESVPAYLRRNMELHNSIADVESFYSNYTVKSNENKQAEISTINTFLEGKKPD